MLWVQKDHVSCRSDILPQGQFLLTAMAIFLVMSHAQPPRVSSDRWPQHLYVFHLPHSPISKTPNSNASSSTSLLPLVTLLQQPNKLLPALSFADLHLMPNLLLLTHAATLRDQSAKLYPPSLIQPQVRFAPACPTLWIKLRNFHIKSPSPAKSIRLSFAAALLEINDIWCWCRSSDAEIIL